MKYGKIMKEREWVKLIEKDMGREVVYTLIFKACKQHRFPWLFLAIHP